MQYIVNKYSTLTYILVYKTWLFMFMRFEGDTFYMAIVEF